MKLHKGATRKIFGGGRMSAAWADGMNIADSDDAVTCKFCLKLMARQRKQ